MIDNLSREEDAERQNVSLKIHQEQVYTRMNELNKENVQLKRLYGELQKELTVKDKATRDMRLHFEELLADAKRDLEN